MNAALIRAGDTLVSEGALIYTVEEVTADNGAIAALVRYIDGGTSVRVWADTQDVPLTRP